MDKLCILVDGNSSGSSDWTKALEEFNSTFAAAFEFDESFTADSLKSVIDFLMRQIKRFSEKSDDSWSPDAVALSMTTIKIFTRTKIGLESLYSAQVFSTLMKMACIDDDQKHNFGDLAGSIILNLCIIGREKGIECLKGSPLLETSISIIQGNSSMISRAIFCRILAFSCSDSTWALNAVKNSKVYETVLKEMIKVSENSKFFLEKDPCMLFCECWKVICHISMHDEQVSADLVKGLDEDILKQTTDVIVNVLSLPLESDPEFESKTNADVPIPNISWAKIAVVDALIFIRNDRAALVTSLKVLEGLGELLEFQAKRKGSPETQLAPLLLLLTGLCKGSKESMTYFRHLIWGPKCDEKKPESESSSSKDPPMEAPKSDYESELRDKLIEHITTYQMTLKTTVSDFLFALCYDESPEYILRVGFGNAVGLMAEKGFPGFENISQRAIGLDELVAMKKKAEEKDGSSPTPEQKAKELDELAAKLEKGASI
eukprot:233087_1